MSVLAYLREAGVEAHRMAKTAALAPIVTDYRLQVAGGFLVEAGAVLRAVTPGMWARAKEFRESTPVTPSLQEIDGIVGSVQGAMAPARAGQLREAATLAMEAGHGIAVAEVGAVQPSFNVDHPHAIRHFETHGLNRIHGIDDTTRQYLRTELNQALRNGEPYDRVARRIAGRYAEFGTPSPLGHIRSRAELIAVTEMGDAYAAGTLAAAQELADAGLRMQKRWLTTGDARVCFRCIANEGAGWIPLDEAFPSGVEHPTAHPGCRCDIQTERIRRSRSERV